MKQPFLVIEDISYSYEGSFFTTEYDIKSDLISEVEFPNIQRVAKPTEAIPLDAFGKDLSCLQTIVIYLRSQGWELSRIAKITKRDPRTIWTTEHEAKKRVSKQILQKIADAQSANSIPLKIFSDRRIGSLEALTHYLRSQGWKNKDIAKSLNLDVRTTSASAKNALRKIGGAA